MLPLAFLPPAIRPAERPAADPADGRVRAANAALERLWTKGWATPPVLEPDALVARAAPGAVMPEDGSGWRRRLDLLCDDLHRHARLTNLGRVLAQGQLVAALGNRVRAQAMWRRHPEIAAQPLPAPIVIVGQMRSGTTRMQRLLACDPRLSFTRFYESWNPLPAAATRPLVDDRKLKGWVGLLCARLLNPVFDTIHPTAWDAPDEEIGLHNLSIYGAAFEAQWRLPRYTAAIEEEDPTAVYREFRRLLQTLAWLRRDKGDRPWVLKVPQFGQDLATVLRVFPDARLICLDRDWADVVGSSASLVRNQMALQSDAVDPQWIDQEWQRKVRLRSRRIAAARATADVAQVEVAYTDMSDDWQAQMRRVYRMLDLPLTDAVVGRMDRYLRDARQGMRRRHDYEPAVRHAPMADRTIDVDRALAAS